MKVTKRDGTLEELDINKFHKVVEWACADLSGVSASTVEIKSGLSLYDGISTKDIQQTLINAAAELISENNPNYQYVASRLINYELRKEVWGGPNPPSLYDHVKKVIDLGFYDSDLLDQYTEKEWHKINSYINHDRDDSIVYAGMEQFRGKYLVKNRSTGEMLETPQFLYILIAATLFNKDDNRMKWIKDYYDAISLHYLSLPTPIMAGVRTPQKQYSSCVLIESGDSLDSINATSSAIIKYVSQRAGIGIGAGSIRAINSPIRNGQATHTGIIPFLKHFQSAVRSCSQGSIRNGAGTVWLPIWHLEVEKLLVLKNNRGTEDNRIRHMDYGFQFNKIMYERLIQGKDITLFSPSDVPDLMDAWYRDSEEFRVLYEKYERAYSIRKTKVPAIDIFTKFIQERKDTGRIYLQNIDHANDHSPFDPEVAPIKLSNLCAEIGLPTVPLKHIFDDEGEIALCILSALNWGLIKNPSDFEKWATLAVRGLDALISHQSYPVLAAQIPTLGRRPVGVGIVNFAYFLVKNGLDYQNIDKKGLALIDEYAEAWSYYLIKASNDLAKEKGECEYNDDTKYSRGIVPIDTRKKDIDTLVPHKERMPWKQLRKDLETHGIRNSTLMALMPSETSSQCMNATNGVEPPRALVSVKQSKDGVLSQVVPEIRKYKNKYDLLWDQKSPEGYLKIMAVLSKYVDQAISVNTSYNPAFYEDEKVPMSEMLNHILFAYKYGIKHLYYNNTHDGAGEINLDERFTNAENNDKIETNVDTDECESCTI